MSEVISRPGTSVDAVKTFAKRVFAPDIAFRHFATITFQLLLVLSAFHLYQLEQSQGFLLITPVILVGFIVHAWLPKNLRPAFFLLLSLSAVAVVLGFVHSVLLISIGLGIFLLCHLPIAFWMRVALIVGAGVVMVALRAEWIPSRFTLLPTLVLPILGSMFMFRLIVYLYHLRHETKPATIWERLSYFFMLPNVIFLLFPVIDYQTYRRTYYDTSAHEVYQKGVLWMMRGLVHLLLYRAIYYYMVLSPAEVQGLWGVAQSMLTTYLLYLRISGQFHLIIGIMCLFGYNLPETHHLYYLASSFNDYWRRINIYWKDFMMKIFYYPSFMKIRKWGMTTSLVVSTLLVFMMTWLLHSYQWFWLRGTFPVTGPDMLFWGILGALVVFNAVQEAKRGRKRSLGKQSWSARGAFVHASKVAGMFVFITILWSLWSSHSLSAWGVLISAAGQSGLVDWVGLLLLIAAAIGLGVLFQYLTHRGWQLSLVGSNPPFRKSAAVTGFVLGLLVVVGLPDVHGRFEARTAAMIASLQEEKLNEHDEEEFDRGYYEGLLNADKFTSALWTVQPKPKDWVGAGRDSDIVRKTGDMLEYELLPSLDTMLKHAPFRTNRWGMRDQDYGQQKHPDTYRIAMIGSSYAMGAGVAENETFEAVAEERLNQWEESGDFTSFEILNLSVGGYSVLHNVAVAETKALTFDPDLVLLVLHTTEEGRLGSHLFEMIQGNSTADHPELAELLRLAGAEPSMNRLEIDQRLESQKGLIMMWALEEIAAMCKRSGIVPVAAMIPTTDEAREMHPQRLQNLMSAASSAGFTVLNLEGAYGELEPMQVRLAGYDSHPNVLGHRLIGEKLFEEVAAREYLVRRSTVEDVVPE